MIKFMATLVSLDQSRTQIVKKSQSSASKRWNLLFCFSSITVSFSVSPCRFDEDATNGTLVRLSFCRAIDAGEVELPVELLVELPVELVELSAASKQSAVASTQIAVSDHRQMYDEDER